MVPCCYEAKSHCTETKCYHVIKFDQLNAPLLLRHNKKASALWLVYFFGCFLAFIAMFEHQNWNQPVFWQVHALSFSIRTKTFDLVNFSRYFYWTQGPPILKMISDLRHLYHICPWSDVFHMGCYLCYENCHRLNFVLNFWIL